MLVCRKLSVHLWMHVWICVRIYVYIFAQILACIHSFHMHVYNFMHGTCEWKLCMQACKHGAFPYCISRFVSSHTRIHQICTSNYAYFRLCMHACKCICSYVCTWSHECMFDCARFVHESNFLCMNAGMWMCTSLLAYAFIH